MFKETAVSQECINLFLLQPEYLVNIIILEEWCLLGFYAVWLL
jgi:hypothetical protein